MKREEKIVNAITDSGFEYKGREYKPLTTRTLLILEKFKSTFYVGGDQLRGLMDYLYVACHDPKVINRFTTEQWEDGILDFAEEFSPEDLKTLSELVKTANDDSASTIVEVREESEKKP
jgi:hypothetical protein